VLVRDSNPLNEEPPSEGGEPADLHTQVPSSRDVKC